MEQLERPARLLLHAELIAAVPAQADLTEGDAVVVVVIEEGQLLHVGNAVIFKADPAYRFHFFGLLGKDNVVLSEFQVTDVAVAARHKVPFEDGSDLITSETTWLQADGYQGFLQVALSDVRLLSAAQAAQTRVSPSASPAAKKQASSSGVGPKPVAMPKLPTRPADSRRKEDITKFFSSNRGRFVH